MPQPANKLCEVCQENPATVHLTEMSNQHVVLEKHMCDVCAAKQGLIGKAQIGITELLGTLKGAVKAGKEPELKCPECGITYTEFRAKARFGCARDYDIFKKHVAALIEKIHGSTQHVGKRPKNLAPAPAEPAPSKPAVEAPPKPAKPAKAGPTVAELEKDLDKAVAAEEFEKAAKLRDRIREMKAKKERPE